MIRLGTCDTGCRPTDTVAYFRDKHEPAMPPSAQFRGERVGEWHRFVVQNGDEVATVQRFLQRAGFFPFGKIDGLCGYRTTSSMRLFQEYVRSIEGDASIGAPDGVFGRKSFAHMQRWIDDGLVAEWRGFSSQRPNAEYRQWMQLLEHVRDHYRREPTALLQRIRDYHRPTDTLPVDRWDFDPRRIHLIGVRRDEAKPGQRQNDDVFVLLINGAVFKFYGTTDPGKSSHRAGAPFLVHGQHHYRFGWHKQSDQNKVYQALKPRSSGVLIVRDSDRDFALTQSDLAGSLENNNSINIHWGGRGVSNWSEGCQVICGRGYINHRNEVVDCSRFAATTYATLGTKVDGMVQSKGAYSVLVDLVTAFSGSEYALDYMLLYEADLRLDPGFGDDMAARINAVMRKL